MSFLRANHRSTRAKIFGTGKPQPLCRNAKARIMHAAKALMRRTLPGRAWGVLSAKCISVLETLLFGFHGRSGLAYPAYEAIAERAACARSTVAESIKALESVGLITWANRLVRRREAGQTRVMRSSNSYQFTDPNPGQTSKSDPAHSTRIPDLRRALAPAAPIEFDRRNPMAGIRAMTTSARWG
jgi:DNA-binding FadR family transcriptional regulator